MEETASGARDIPMNQTNLLPALMKVPVSMENLLPIQFNKYLLRICNKQALC
jgi:hypothetical protein